MGGGRGNGEVGILGRILAWSSMSMALVLLILACSGDRVADGDPLVSPPAPATPTFTATATEADDVASPEVRVEELSTSSAAVPTDPGSYTTDLLPLRLSLQTAIPLAVIRAEPGAIVVEPVPTPADFTGLGLFAVDTLIDADTRGVHRARIPATVDLTGFLDSRDGMRVTQNPDTVLGGLPAQSWTITYDPCAGCAWQPLFNTTGWANTWGNPPGFTQELITVDTPGSPLMLTIEAPDETFAAWREEVQAGVLDGLRFDGATGYTRPRPGGLAGPHPIGRAETVVVDPGRPTQEVVRDGAVVVPATDERRLLLSVAYPARDEGGFGSPAVDGPLPLVVVAPALRDAAVALPADRLLASHGYVVVTVRFPETSFPGNLVAGVPAQPADVAVVLDRVLDGSVLSDIDVMVDPDRIGLIGHSAGATTALGVLDLQCCRDDRLAAVIAHAGTPFAFGSERTAAGPALLHVASAGDQTAPVAPIRAHHEATPGASTLAVLELAPHLGWLMPDAPSFGDAFALTLGFLDQHLRGRDVDVQSLGQGAGFVEVDER